jgi:Diacylglycerol kinase catalytic domain
MKRTLLIINAASGSAGAVSEEEVFAGLAKAELEVVETVRLPDGELPKQADVVTASISVVAILSGDGTIASVCKEMDGWDGDVLVLPGGTMNLLSRRLHGERTVAELLDTLDEAPAKGENISVVKTPEGDVYTGLIAGPSTQWGEVRESIRNFDIGELVEKVPEAWAATTTSESVRIEGRDGGYPAIFVEPLDNGSLGVRAFRADGVGDMVSHGIAWLRRDFRDGPNDDLGEMREVTIVDDSDQKLGLLIDGEQSEGHSPLTCVAAMSSVRFLRTAW